MYVRFVTANIDPASERESGVFREAYAMLDSEALPEWEEAVLRDAIRWFRENLTVPDRFTASKPPHYRKQQRAISWFKETATEHIAKMREIVAVLEGHGRAVEMISSTRVGYVVYEDECQVVAEPFADSLE